MLNTPNSLLNSQLLHSLLSTPRHIRLLDPLGMNILPLLSLLLGLLLPCSRSSSVGSTGVSGALVFWLLFFLLWCVDGVGVSFDLVVL